MKQDHEAPTYLTVRVQNVEPDWLDHLHGEWVHVDISMAGLRVMARGWALFDWVLFGVNESREVTDRKRPARCDDPDDHIDFWLDECTPAIGERGGLVFHRDGRILGDVSVLVPRVPADGWGTYTPPGLVWTPELTGTTVEVQNSEPEWSE